jgi:hypothetical protein
MSTRTLGALATRHGVDLLDHLDQQLQIPVLSGIQFQGDVAVVPCPTLGDLIPGLPAGEPVPAAGVAVVRGENGGHTHLLVADGPVSWAAGRGSGGNLTLGTVTVPGGAIAYLLHPEHGGNALAPGSYELRRQREQREEIALVAD